jgi:hypothetical protein
MDGRVQLPVIKHLHKRFNAKYVDSITNPGPNLILSEQNNLILVKHILDRLTISIEKHNSEGIAIAGHFDCAGNPAPKEKQIEHIQKAIQFLHGQYEKIEIIGLWVDENLEVQEITSG